MSFEKTSDHLQVENETGKNQMNRSPELAQIISDAWKPPSSDPAWRWAEQHITLDNTAAMQGRYSIELVPFLRVWYDQAQHPRCRRHVTMVSAQSAKTQNMLNFLCWSIVEDPAPTMWVMASSDNCKEFKKKRLDGALENCPPARALLPADQDANTRTLVKFSSMNLLLRGSNSRIGLQSDPIRRIICDERREWRPGAIDLLRKRLRTFANSIELGCGTAGIEGDELHRDFEEGSQTFIHWRCINCNHSQPFRFGRKPTPLFPTARERGGLIWDENGITRPNGEWNWEELAKTVRYECEHCGHRYKNSDKFALMKSWHPHHRREWMLPEYFSVHWNALYMPWSSCDWAEIAKEFLVATSAWQAQKDIEPLRAFITETLGEPWRDLEGQKVEQGVILDRRGVYTTKEPGKLSKDAVRVATVDVQEGYIVVVVREWKLGGASRLLVAKKLLDFDELKKLQTDLEIRDRCVWIDSAHNTRDVLEACQANGRWINGRDGKPAWDGWSPMLGDDAEEFTVHSKAGPLKQHWKRVDIDPGIGTSKQGISRLPRYSWSNPHYKEQLYFYVLPGKSHSWELPSDIHDDYIKQMQVTERIPIYDGEKKLLGYEWKERGRHDYSDCELMQLVVADIGGLIKA